MSIRLLIRLAGFLAVFVIYGAAAPAVVADERESSASAPQEEEESTGHELGHVLQQRQARPAPSTTPRKVGERVMQPSYGAGDDPDAAGRVKLKMPTQSVPTESLSLNYRKVNLSSTRVIEVRKLQNRGHVVTPGNRLFALPDGTYRNKAGDEIRIQGGSAKPDWEGDVIIAPHSTDEDARYRGPGGAWLETRGGKIVAVGGSLRELVSERTQRK